MKKEALLIILLLLLPFASAQLADSPWPMYSGGANHDGQSTIDTTHINGTVKWAFETGGAIESSPTIGEDGTIYVGTHDNKLYAINPDGTLKWDFYVGEPPLYDDRWNNSKGILSVPAIAKDGTIYFSSLSDIFFAINPDGTEKWRHTVPISADTWTSPTIGEDGTIYTGSSRRFTEGSKEDLSGPTGVSGLYAFNPDGTVKWFYESESDIQSSPAIGRDGTIYSDIDEDHGNAEADSFLYAFNPDGEIIWKYHTKFTESSPTVAPDGTIYIGTGHSNRGFVAINPDGTEKWFISMADDISAIPAIGKDGTIYIGVWDGMFYALNPDGTEKWSFETPKKMEAITASAAIGAEGTIYFGAADGMYALNPDGTEKWSYKKDKITGIVSSPAIGADGTVYIGSWNNKLYAFGERAPGEDPYVSEEWDTRPSPGNGTDWEGPGEGIGIEEKTEWTPEGVDCFNPESKEIEEKCDMFCYDNPEECPDYFEKKGKGFKEAELNFFQKLIYWLKSLFS